MLALMPLTILLPRWLTPADAGYAGGAVAAAIFLLSLAGIAVVSLILFLFTWFNRDTLSGKARIVGLAPFPLIGTGWLLLWMNMVF